MMMEDDRPSTSRLSTCGDAMNSCERSLLSCFPEFAHSNDPHARDEKNVECRQRYNVQYVVAKSIGNWQLGQ